MAAEQLSRSITASAWHAMLAGHKDDGYKVMGSIADAQGVDYIRMFAKMGKVAFSTDPANREDVDIEADVCRVCHAVEPPRVELGLPDRVRFVEPPEGGRHLAILTPILNEPACSTADCHAHAAETRVLGILDLSLDLGNVDAQTRKLAAKYAVITFLIVLGIGLFLAFFIHRLVGVPIRKLIRGTRAVGAMDLGWHLDVTDETELGELAGSFQSMQVNLQKVRAERDRIFDNLEHQVAERSRELEATQEKLIQSDRLASLGQLSASVAHEVNNPLSAVLNLSIFLQRILQEDGIPPDRLDQFRRHLGQIADETERAGRIVKDLLSFSRRSVPERAPADLNEIIERTAALVHHRAELSGVALEFELLPDLPLVSCDRSQIEQVLLNLVLNAIEAMSDGGRITIRTGTEDATRTAVLQVQDDGPGIPRENVRRVFDPFFSTKEGEKGAGLGLSVAYGIVEAHGGRLNVHSEVGRGTTFTVRLLLDASGPPVGEEAGS